MAHIITIPVPCHEDWNEMTPVEIGRHCAQCAKTVVDFTEKTQGEVLHYLETHKDQKTCGRFTATQLNTPIPTPEDFVKKISWFRMSTLKKAAAIFLFAFMVAGSSCNEAIQGKAVNNPTTITGDTVPVSKPVLLGEPAIPDTPAIKQPAKIKCDPTPDRLMGDVVYDSTITMGMVATVVLPVRKDTVLPEREQMIKGKMIIREEPKTAPAGKG